MKLRCVEIVRAALGEPIKRTGDELLYHCTSHNDHNPSLKINEKKNCWMCGPCGVSGGAWKLAAFFAGCGPEDVPSVKAWLTEHGLLFARGDTVLEKIYPYPDESGKLLFEILRYKTKYGKKFKARRQYGSGWTYSLKKDAKRQLESVRIVPYHLSEVIAAREVHIHEGEQCCDDFSQAFGLVSTTAPFGAGKWPDDFAQYFRGCAVYVYPDNDKPGQQHADDAARNVYSGAAFVKIITLPELPAKGDVSDWIDAGHTKEELLALLAETPAWTPPSKRDVGTREDTGHEETQTGQGSSLDPVMTGNDKESTATRLVKLADGVDLFHTRDGIGYANFSVGNHFETWAVRSRQFQRYLTKKFYDAERTAPSAQALRDATATIDAKANFDGPEQEVFVRVAELNGVIYLDLADEQWRAVQISTSGWGIVNAPPIRFRRTRGMLALPAPARGGKIDELDQFINVREEDKQLLRVWTSAAMMPRGPYPILNVHGEQGSAKSTTEKVLRGLIDPNRSPLRTLPHDERDLQIAANNSHLLGFDNASHLLPWLSDALCRLATGGGLATRELYTDQEEVIFEAQRPVLLNGIEDLASRGDYLQRSIVIYLPEIAETARRSEEEFWPAFEEARPRILGALLDAMAEGLRKVGTVHLEKKPRMADFAIWGVAVEPALGLEAGAFLKAYGDSTKDANALALESSIVAPYIIAFINDCRNWKGTAGKLLEQINSRDGERFAKEKGWPKSPRALSGALRRLAPNLRTIGVQVIFLKREADRRLIELAKVNEQPSPPSSGPRIAGSARVEPSSLPSPEPSCARSLAIPPDDGCDVDDGNPVSIDIEI